MVCEPLELEYIAGGIPEHDVRIIDLIFDRDLPEKIRSFNPAVIGTSSYITGVNKVKEICRTAKDINPGILTIIGGVHATLVPEDYDDASIDIIVRGNGIKIIQQIIDEFSSNKEFEKIPNLCFPTKNGLQFTASAPLSVDVENFPLPRRDLIEKYRQRYYYLFHQPVALMKTTFGCPFNCNFCFCWPLTEGKVSIRSPHSIVSELEKIKSKDVYIVDDTFFIDVDHLSKLRNLIIERKIDKRYLIYSHADFIVRHPQIIKDWAEIGLKACIVGLESPLEGELKKYNKKATVECNTEAIHILRKNHIDTYGSFIVDPDWGEREFVLLDNYIKKVGLYYIVIQPLTPLPGTKIFSKYEAKITIERKKYELWDMQHSVLPTKLPPKEFYKKIRQIYVKNCLNPWRAHTLQLRTTPPILSKKYLRLLSGAIRIFLAMKKAHKHPGLLESKN
jgi:radical SAM superfamily enzyme YgiQ (UPF0313 family)